jgi:hypothetical protein
MSPGRECELSLAGGLEGDSRFLEPNTITSIINK